MVFVNPVTYAIQNLLVLLNSSWISALYHDIVDTIWIIDKTLLHFNSQNQVKFTFVIIRVQVKG